VVQLLPPWCGKDGGRVHESGGDGIPRRIGRDVEQDGSGCGALGGMGHRPPCCVCWAHAREAPSGPMMPLEQGWAREACVGHGACIGLESSLAQAREQLASGHPGTSRSVNSYILRCVKREKSKSPRSIPPRRARCPFN
jgi:hypothetical protein